MKRYVVELGQRSCILVITNDKLDLSSQLADLVPM